MAKDWFTSCIPTSRYDTTDHAAALRLAHPPTEVHVGHALRLLLLLCKGKTTRGRALEDVSELSTQLSTRTQHKHETDKTRTTDAPLTLLS